MTKLIQYSALAANKEKCILVMLANKLESVSHNYIYHYMDSNKDVKPLKKSPSLHDWTFAV